MAGEKTDKQQQLQIRKTLRAYGLSDNEIEVYLAAIKLDETSPYELAKLTGIARTTVYDVITDLSLKGLLELERSDGFPKQQTKIIAKNPSVLRQKLRERRKESHIIRSWPSVDST
jgi:sugar-specific transcriptional regulator TrmB